MYCIPAHRIHLTPTKTALSSTWHVSVYGIHALYPHTPCIHTHVPYTYPPYIPYTHKDRTAFYLTCLCKWYPRTTYTLYSYPCTVYPPTVYISHPQKLHYCLPDTSLYMVYTHHTHIHLIFTHFIPMYCIPTHRIHLTPTKTALSSTWHVSIRTFKIKREKWKVIRHIFLLMCMMSHI